MKKTTTLFALLMLLALPALAAGGGDGEINIFAGDFGNVLWTLVTLCLVVFVLGKFAWGPLLNTLKERESFIHDSLEKAKQEREAAEEQHKKYADKLAEARAEATAIVEEGRRDAEVLRKRIEQEAQVEADKMVERAKREIQIARETAVKELYDLTGKLATSIATHVVGREIKADDHERLIDEALDEMSGGTN